LAAACQCSSRGLGGSGIARPAIVSVRISPSRIGGWSSSQRRKRTLVRTPSSTVPWSAARSRVSASSRFDPWAISFASIGS
jgi:hypothetical protein